MSPALWLYLAFTHISGPLWQLAHRRRLKRGKEVPERLPEKYGSYSVKRPPGELLWFHALSVGESFALLPLIELALKKRPDAHVVLTTSTASSVEALAKADLPDRCFHILLPIDTPGATRSFLDYWQPAVAAFAELDFWPRLMVETHRRGIPMILINSRMPDGNFASRKRLGGMMREVLQLFARLLVQDDLSADRFVSLGAPRDRTTVLGALKAAARPLPADEAQLTEMKTAIVDRPVWCAAATERSEHPAMVKAHRKIVETLPNALLILAPRFKEDGPKAEELARAAFRDVSRRSAGGPLSAEIQVYVADTFGEMGLWYRLAPISFVGHSLTPGLEGKNPFEAAALGSAILTGPHVSYFSESYQSLLAAQGCREVEDATALAGAVLNLQNAEERQAMLDGAARVIEARRGVLTKTWAEIEGLLPA